MLNDIISPEVREDFREYLSKGLLSDVVPYLKILTGIGMGVGLVVMGYHSQRIQQKINHMRYHRQLSEKLFVRSDVNEDGITDWPERKAMIKRLGYTPDEFVENLENSKSYEFPTTQELEMALASLD